MLHTLKELVGFTVLATDGEIGTVRDFLFDDVSWMISYVVVDVGNWFNRQYVVLAISAVEQPDRTKKIFHVRLTKEQVRDSPDTDTEKPVSRQQEIAMEEYFGKLAVWVQNVLAQEDPIPTGRKYPVHTQEDPHLRSAWHLIGYKVWATDGEIGRLEGLIKDEASWHIGYLDVEAGEWFPDHSMLIPTSWIKSVSWDDCRVNLQHTREGI
jgi:uncharacterized protein YrrD